MHVSYLSHECLAAARISQSNESSADESLFFIVIMLRTESILLDIFGYCLDVRRQVVSQPSATLHRATKDREGLDDSC